MERCLASPFWWLPHFVSQVVTILSRGARGTNAFNKRLGFNRTPPNGFEFGHISGRSRVPLPRWVDSSKPSNPPLKVADRNLNLLVRCGCKPHRTCRGNTRQLLAWESAITLRWKPRIRWEGGSRTIQRDVVIVHHTTSYIHLAATTPSNALHRSLMQVLAESRNPSLPALAQNKGRATLR